MVNLNLTLVIELALFLVFLWGASKFILAPALETIDSREEGIAQDNARAETLVQQAEDLEGRYAQAIGAARTQAEQAFREAHTRAVESHATTMAGARRSVDERVLQAREEGLAQLESRRAEVLRAAPALADELMGRLGLGGRGS